MYFTTKALAKQVDKSFMQKQEEVEEVEERQEEPEIFELKTLKEYEELTSAHTDQQFNELVDSLREHGQLVPGLVNQHNIILDAHHRYRGSQKARNFIPL